MDLNPARTLVFRPHEPENAAAWALRAILAGAAIGAWFVPHFSTATATTMSGTAILGLAVALVAPMLPSREPRPLRGVEVIWSTILALHLAGHFFSWYNNLAHYDTFLHGAGGFLGGIAGYWLGRATPLFWDADRVTPFRAFWVAVSIAVIGGALVEAVEYASDVLVGTDTQTSPGQSRIKDTMIDLYAELVMSVVAGLLAAWWTHRRGNG